MKIFIAGARSISTLDDYITSKLNSISNKNFDVLVGDCYGVDTAVQSFFANRSYRQVVVYASNGKVRNNKGKWATKAVPVNNQTQGFDYYRQKDIAMAADADWGFMIWDGDSKGTLQNILTLTSQNKPVLVYLPEQQFCASYKSISETRSLLNVCTEKARKEYRDFVNKHQLPNQYTEQIAMQF